MLSDLRQAIRLLIRQRAFTLAACATLALGIGANTAIFSVVDAALFRPLPYRDPDRLVDIVQVMRRGRAEETRSIGMSWQSVADWRAQPQVFEALATFGESRTLAVGNGADAVPRGVGRLSPGFLAFLGLVPVAGREFVADDLKGDSAVAILSASWWRQAFNADPAAIGRTIVVDGRRVTIVGVAPSTFRYRVFGKDLWLPQMPGQPRQITGVLARIRPGLTLPQAEQELDRAAERIKRERPTANPWEVDLEPIDTRRERDTASTMLLLVGAVGCVLLIACANVANLLLARTLMRQREVTIRTAVGATRGRLFRQLLVEGFLLAAVGGVAGILIAFWCTALIPAIVPAQLHYDLFATNPIEVDRRLAGAALAAITLTALFCSLAPAIRGSQTSGIGALTSVAGATPAGRRLRQAFLALQVGATLVLVVGAGLLVNSFVRMVSAEPGFDIDRLGSVGVNVDAKPGAPTGPELEAAFAALIDRARAIPGVEAAGFGTPPAVGLGGRFVVERAGGQPEETPGGTSLHYVDPGYFDLTGIPLRAGRGIAKTDTGSEPVAVIDEVTARRAFPGESPLGRRFRYSPYVRWITIVGVVGRVKTQAFTSRQADAQLYLPLTQTSMPVRFLLLRSAQPSAAASDAMAIVPTVHPALSVGLSFVGDDAYESTLSAPRFYLILMSALAAIALLTASVGLNGLLACAVSERTREIGVRVALGADRRGVVRLMLRDALVPVVAGLMGGLLASAWLTRYLETMLYQVRRLDPSTLALAVVSLLVVAGCAAVAPLRRALRVDPITALKTE